MGSIARAALAAALMALAAHGACADGTLQSRAHALRVVEVARGLEHPWGLAFLPDGRMLVTERPGRLRIVEDGRLLPQPVAGLPEIAAQGQGGLLDVALHPRFGDNGLVYLSYAARGEGGLGTQVARGRLAGARLEDVQVIFSQVPKLPGGRHFGSRLAFDAGGRLYITLGDRGEAERAQRLDDHLGVVVRLDDDGGVPPDNPLVGRPGARPEIWSWGHRNVQGAAFDPVTGRLWATEHGPQGGDELNLLRPGVNYGWPVISHGADPATGAPIGEGTQREGMAQPVHHWTPSVGSAGLALYRGGRFPGWQGDLFVAGMDARALLRLKLDDGRVVEEERLLEGVGRVRDVRAGPDGLLYLLVDDGRLLRIEPAP